MNEETRATLSAINRRFYERVAAEFDATRDHPWPGWDAVLEELPAGPLRVLDVGCGNGRFAAFLAARIDGALEYCGLDANASLLARAREANAALAQATFEQCDLLSSGFFEEPPHGPFDLVAVFGLLHHIPSFDARQALLADLASRLAPGGLLAATQWRFAASERFARHRVTWEAYNQRAAEDRDRSATAPVDTTQLEPGDHLVDWRGQSDVPRYCHFSDDAETARSIEALCNAVAGVKLARRYRADGRSGDLNEYLLFRRTGAIGLDP